MGKFPKAICSLKAEEMLNESNYLPQKKKRMMLTHSIQYIWLLVNDLFLRRDCLPANISITSTEAHCSGVDNVNDVAERERGRLQ